MIHQMRLSATAYDSIASGGKSIEARIFDDKRRQVAVGDEIIFSQIDQPEKSFRVIVTDLYKHPTFAELFQDHDPVLFGGASREELSREIREYYFEDKEKEYGVVGIRFKLL